MGIFLTVQAPNWHIRTEHPEFPLAVLFFHWNKDTEPWRQLRLAAFGITRAYDSWPGRGWATMPIWG